MVMDFCFLTRNALFCPQICNSGHVGPNKMRRRVALMPGWPRECMC
jgi:hypothetical protein